MFHVGQDVVCVDARDTGAVVKGRVYRIKGIRRVYLDLVGVGEDSIAPGMMASRFRPVVEKKTDISWAEEILRRESIDTPERVS